MTTKEPVYGIHRALERVGRGYIAANLGGVSERRLARWIKEDPAGALQKCVEAVGSQVALAKIIGVAQRTISVWIAADLPNREEPAPRNAVEAAVRKAGGQPRMAEELGVTQQCVSNWCRQGYVPASRAQEIEVCYGVPRADLINPKLRNAMGVGGEL